MKVNFKLNGKEVDIDANPASRLLDVLRERFGLVGVKEGCGEGECGACAVLLDGKLVHSCLVPLANVIGREVITIEGLRNTEEYKVIEEALLDAGSVQCGFCTPGFVMAIYALLKSNPQPDDEEIRKAISGNLCRCTGYQMIIDGIKLAAKRGERLWKA